jgi:DNA-directed RNA polymerase specialized sigma24 family protein
VELSGAPTRGSAEVPAFELLLAALHPDRERAGEAYERIRRRLVKFFEWRGARLAEELGDETLDRVMKKLAEGEQIRAADPLTYCYGVARNVLREHWDRERRAPESVDAEAIADGAPSAAAADEAERRFECLERCLGQAPPETRRLVVAYYQQQGLAKIRGRQALAAGLGIGVNALRLRLHRIRADLEACVRRCLAGETKRPAAHTSRES